MTFAGVGARRHRQARTAGRRAVGDRTHRGGAARHHLSAEGAEIPLEGDWDLEVTVRTSDIDQTVFETVVPVT